MPSTPLWPDGCQGALSLTYDDALNCHHQHVGPELESHGLRGTFYVCVSDDLLRNPAEWRALAGRGHELGNHSLFHPCRREKPEEMTWLNPAYNLCIYSERRIRDELRTANLLLSLIDGRLERTYGNTCHHTHVGPPEARVSMEPVLAELFVAARGEFTGRPVDPSKPNFANLGTHNGDRKTAQALQNEIEAAAAQGGWLIYCFHGVGQGTHNHFIDAAEHRRLCEFLEARAKHIWTAPVVEVAKHLKRASGLPA